MTLTMFLMLTGAIGLLTFIGAAIYYHNLGY